MNYALQLKNPSPLKEKKLLFQLQLLSLLAGCKDELLINSSVIWMCFTQNFSLHCLFHTFYCCTICSGCYIQHLLRCLVVVKYLFRFSSNTHQSQLFLLLGNVYSSVAVVASDIFAQHEQAIVIF